MGKCKRFDRHKKRQCLSFLAGVLVLSLSLPKLSLAQNEPGGMVLVLKKVEIPNNGHYEYGREGFSRETIDLKEGLFHQTYWKRDGQGRMLLEVESTIKFKAPPAKLQPGQKLDLPANGIMTVKTDIDPTNILASLSYEMTRNYGVGFTGENRIALERHGERSQIISPSTIIDPSSKGGIQISVKCSRGLSIVWTYELERDPEIERRSRIRNIVREILTRKGPAVAKVMEVSGTVEILTGGGSWRPVRQGEKIMRGDKIRTGSPGRIRINCNPPEDDSEPRVANVGPLSEISIAELVAPYQGLDVGWLMLLKRGAIRLIHRNWGSRDPIFSIKAGTTLLGGQRGTEFITTYNPETDRAGWYLIDGFIDVLDTAENRNVTLYSLQKLDVDNGRVGTVQPLNRELWDSLIDKHGLEDVAPLIRSQTVEFFLNEAVTAIKFYEGGYNGVPLDQRNYQPRFAKSATRFIYWELNLEFPPPGRTIDFDIVATWHNSDGSVLTSQKIPASIEPGWDNFYHNSGWGWREPGQWKTGIYRVELSIDNQTVATGFFYID